MIFIFVMLVVIILPIYLLSSGNYFTSDKFIYLKSEQLPNLELQEELMVKLQSISEDYYSIIEEIKLGFQYSDTTIHQSSSASFYILCSRNIVNNASREGFKYISKYYKLNPSPETLDHLDNMIRLRNDYAVKSKELLELRSKIRNDMLFASPITIQMWYKTSLYNNLKINEKIPIIEDLYFEFYYRSPGGRSNYFVGYKLDGNNLENYKNYIFSKLKPSRSVNPKNMANTIKKIEKPSSENIVSDEKKFIEEANIISDSIVQNNEIVAEKWIPSSRKIILNIDNQSTKSEFVNNSSQVIENNIINDTTDIKVVEANDISYSSDFVYDEIQLLALNIIGTEKIKKDDLVGKLKIHGFLLESFISEVNGNFEYEYAMDLIMFKNGFYYINEEIICMK